MHQETILLFDPLCYNEGFVNKFWVQWSNHKDYSAIKRWNGMLHKFKNLIIESSIESKRSSEKS